VNYGERGARAPVADRPRASFSIRLRV